MGLSPCTAGEKSMAPRTTPGQRKPLQELIVDAETAVLDILYAPAEGLTIGQAQTLGNGVRAALRSLGQMRKNREDMLRFNTEHVTVATLAEKF